MVTDGTAQPGNTDALIARVRSAAVAGVDLVQIREPQLEGGSLLRLVEGCVNAVRSSRARVLVNDRLDVALAARAHGVHLRASSFSGSRVREIVPRGFLIGRSVHDVAEVQAATEDGSLDYLIFGTVFATGSKPGRAPVGLVELAAAVRATPLPVLAIGGITVERMGEVRRAGVSGWAAISLFGGSPEGLQLTLEKASLAFDTASRLP